MSTPKTEPRLSREDTRLHLSGPCVADTVAKLDLGSVSYKGIDRIDIHHVDQLDSTGLALIAELVARAEGAGTQRPVVAGRPAGLEDFCRAYRIEPDFSNFP